jgi:hypothetical protein
MHRVILASLLAAVAVLAVAQPPARWVPVPAGWDTLSAQVTTLTGEVATPGSDSQDGRAPDRQQGTAIAALPRQVETLRATLAEHQARRTKIAAAPLPSPAAPASGRAVTEIGPADSIAAALAALPSGGTLILRGGLYAETVTVTRGNYTLVAKTGAKVTIRGTGACGFAILGANVTVRQIGFDGTATADHALCVKGAGAHHVTIEDVEAWGSPRTCAIEFLGAHTVTWRRVHAHDCGKLGSALDHGFYITGADNRLEDVLAERCSGYGIHLYGVSPNPVLDRTVLIRPVARFNRFGINLGNGADLVMQDAVVEDNEGYGVLSHDTLRAKVTNLRVSRNGLVRGGTGLHLLRSVRDMTITGLTGSGNAGGNLLNAGINVVVQ